MISKAKLRSIFLRYSGITSYKWNTFPNGIYCFNYHRVAGTNKGPFDPNIYSCTADRFKEQLDFIKSNFKVISVDELLEKAQEQHQQIVLV